MHEFRSPFITLHSLQHEDAWWLSQHWKPLLKVRAASYCHISFCMMQQARCMLLVRSQKLSCLSLCKEYVMQMQPSLQGACSNCGLHVTCWPGQHARLAVWLD